MLHTYVDESEQGSFLVLAGYLAPNEVWDVFSREWRSELAQEPAVEYFHMIDAANTREQFSGHRPELIEYRIRKLLKIIYRCGLIGVSAVLTLDDFQTIIRPYFARQKADPEAKVMGNPYGFAFYRLVTVLAWRSTLPMAFTFDEKDKHGRTIASVWQDFKRAAPKRMRGLMAEEPTFGNDKLIPALQAADMLAWHLRRYYYDVSVGKRGATPDSTDRLNDLLRVGHVSEMINARGMHKFVATRERRLALLHSRARRRAGTT